METIKSAIQNLKLNIKEQETRSLMSFDEFLNILVAKPQLVIRNVFQVFHDMIKTYVGKGVNEYPDDPESINFVYYDCRSLLVNGTDHPFFADRLFANRLINLVDSLNRGAQQNKIYIFEGPPGCGKSTFLNNLLLKFEEYANTDQGMRYEIVWRLQRNMFISLPKKNVIPILDRVFQNKDKNGADYAVNSFEIPFSDMTLEVPCPSHDTPILMIPKAYRRPFFDDLLQNSQFKYKLFTEKEYEWVFKDNPCTICSSLYQALLSKLNNPQRVFQMLYVRPYQFNRRLGEGISVFNPGDRSIKRIVLTNEMLQKRINLILRDSNLVKYFFSRYAKTNNGIYALMDIKSHNTDRLIELHNIISDGVHKVEDIEENVNSLFLALMNPEDKLNVENIQSFSDRIEYIKLPYVLDINTEVEIYRNVFGRHIDESLLPMVMQNFARVIVATRLNNKSDALLEWIGNPKKYRLYCDENLHLLKMEIYTGIIPKWLSEEDLKRFTAKRRKKIIAESENEGRYGFSGRDSIKIFNEFYSTFARQEKLINMSTLVNFFIKVRKDLNEKIPHGFLESLQRMYDYTVLQEVKESLYYYNETRISQDIQNYLFAINFELGTTATCKFTSERLEITDEFLRSIEHRLLGAEAGELSRYHFRKETQKEYTSKTLTQEILFEDKPITNTELYQTLHDRYVYNLKEKVLDPFLKNENFRRGIKDFGEPDFKTYDKRIRDDVTYLINNICEKYHYTKQGAKEVCIYVIDNDLAAKFNNH
jgi:predicted Ser/Thr protein kinase